MIEINDVTKKYKVSNREAGLLGAIKGLFKKTYKEITAVENLSMKVEKGEIIGFIGANGAGKSTTIKMMCGILHPTSGTIVTNEVIPYEHRTKNAKNIGVVFGQRSQLIWDIALEESLQFQKHVYDIPEHEFKQRFNEFVELLELQDLLRKPVRQMSLGQKMRCELAAAFLHNPAIVYLDEPTIGLDVRIKEIIRKFIVDIVDKYQTTVILTTHDMQDIEALATRIIIIDEGKQVFEGSQKELVKNYGNIKVVKAQVVYGESVITTDIMKEKSMRIEHNENEVEIEFSSDIIAVKDVVSELFNNNEIVDFSILDIPLEEIVKDLYEDRV